MSQRHTDRERQKRESHGIEDRDRDRETYDVREKQCLVSQSNSGMESMMYRYRETQRLENRKKSKNRRGK